MPQVLKSDALLLMATSLRQEPQLDGLMTSPGKEGYLVENILSDGGVKGKLYACTLCHYKSCHSGSITRHVRTHTHEKPYACPFCAHRSAQRSNLKGHMVRCHAPQLPKFDVNLQLGS